MGESIEQTKFEQEDHRIFANHLREETLELKKMLEGRIFEYRDDTPTGLEVEAWLVDQNHLPSPSNEEFLNTCADKNVVEEISKFNFELNTEPLILGENCLSKLQSDLQQTWDRCQKVAEQMSLNPVLVGIHPMVRDEMLQMEYMSEGNRYKALNDQIFHFRKNQPLKIDIKGYDHFQKTLNHLLIEAASTSIQVHIQANQEDFRRVYNASLIASIPCVALAANSPFLYGHDLWSETRIPLFEQAVCYKEFRDKRGQGVGRVTFGTGYIRRSPLEVFLENLDGYSPLIPIHFDDGPEALHHLRFHNGTLWRWNRPIIGFNKQGIPHLRVEQRAMAAGPSLVDIVANNAFSLGLTQYFANLEKAPEESMTFTDCRNNFYSAAHKGLEAKVRWFGKERPLNRLILDELIPMAEKGLKSSGVSDQEINYYLRDILHHRVLSGLNGAQWQRSFVNCYGRDFQALASAYYENQKKGDPVHLWKL